jgi:transcriptional regulator with XRE-family HTH domain
MKEVTKYASFAVRFRAACALINKDHLSQNALGAVLGVSGPMVNYYRTGLKLPSMEKACDIAAITGVSLEWLMLGRGPMLPVDQDASSLVALWDSSSVEERTALLARLASNKSE